MWVHQGMCVNMVCVYMCICVCVHVSIHLVIYLCRNYIYTHTHTHTYLDIFIYSWLQVITFKSYHLLLYIIKYNISSNVDQSVVDKMRIIRLSVGLFVYLLLSVCLLRSAGHWHVWMMDCRRYCSTKRAMDYTNRCLTSLIQQPFNS